MVHGRMEIDIKNILHALMEQTGIDEVAELSRLSGVPQTTLHRLYVGGTPDPRVSTLIPLVDFFNISVDQMIGRKSLKEPAFKEKLDLIPIIPWDKVPAAKAYMKELSQESWPHWEAVLKVTAEQNLFVLEVPQRTMGGIFSYKTKLVIDPNLSPVDGDYVIVHNSENNSVALKHLLVDGSDQWLKSPTEEIQAILMSKIHRICGVVVKATVPLTLNRE
jgi:hypothetical protein